MTAKPLASVRVGSVIRVGCGMFYAVTAVTETGFHFGTSPFSDFDGNVTESDGTTTTCRYPTQWEWDDYEEREAAKRWDVALGRHFRMM